MGSKRRGSNGDARVGRMDRPGVYRPGDRSTKLQMVLDKRRFWSLVGGGVCVGFCFQIFN